MYEERLSRCTSERLGVMKSDFNQVWVLLSGFFTFGQSRTFNVISARILWFKRDFSTPSHRGCGELFSSCFFFLSVVTEQVSSIEARVKTRNSLGGVLKLLPSSEWPLRMDYSLNQIIDLLVFQIAVVVKVL